MKVYTFWEPREKIPYYIQLCMKTWEKNLPNAEIVLMDYKNLHEHVDLNELGATLFSGRFSLAHISDAIRVALLAKRGGIWLDADTIILRPDAEKYFLPDEQNRTVFFGYPENRANHVAFINTPPNSVCMTAWLEFIQKRIRGLTPSTELNTLFLSNSFTNPFARDHLVEVDILDTRLVMPELSIIPRNKEWTPANRKTYYNHYYFLQNHHLTDVDADMLMLHNSWTPNFYKNILPRDLLRRDCTMTNVLAEALDITLPPP